MKGLVFQLLVALLIAAGITSPLWVPISDPAFTHGQQVDVVGGFYRGESGTIQSHREPEFYFLPHKYEVRGVGHKYETIDESDLAVSQYAFRVDEEVMISGGPHEGERFRITDRRRVAESGLHEYRLDSSKSFPPASEWAYEWQIKHIPPATCEGVTWHNHLHIGSNQSCPNDCPFKGRGYVFPDEIQPKFETVERSEAIRHSTVLP